MVGRITAHKARRTHLVYASNKSYTAACQQHDALYPCAPLWACLTAEMGASLPPESPGSGLLIVMGEHVTELGPFVERELPLIRIPATGEIVTQCP